MHWAMTTLFELSGLSFSYTPNALVKSSVGGSNPPLRQIQISPETANGYTLWPQIILILRPSVTFFRFDPSW
jgi:hypothetical protein